MWAEHFSGTKVGFSFPVTAPLTLSAPNVSAAALPKARPGSNRRHYYGSSPVQVKLRGGLKYLVRSPPSSPTLLHGCWWLGELLGCVSPECSDITKLAEILRCELAEWPECCRLLSRPEPPSVSQAVPALPWWRPVQAGLSVTSRHSTSDNTQ